MMTEFSFLGELSHKQTYQKIM